MEKSETKVRIKKASRRAANTRSQQECCVHKNEREIQTSVRNLNAKLKKVVESGTYSVIVACADMLIRNCNPLPTNGHFVRPK